MINQKTKDAIRAAKNQKNWGRRPTRLFCQKRGIAPNVLRAALWCEAVKNAGLI